MASLKNNKQQKRFSWLIAMLLIFLLLILMTFMLPNVLCSCDNAFPNAAKAKISQFSSQLALYKLNNKTYPSTDQGLNALVSNVGLSDTWQQLLSKVDQDPWGNDYQYLFPGIKNPSSFDLLSYGADGVLGGEGYNADIGNWPDEE